MAVIDGYGNGGGVTRLVGGYYCLLPFCGAYRELTVGESDFYAVDFNSIYISIHYGKFCGFTEGLAICILQQHRRNIIKDYPVCVDNGKIAYNIGYLHIHHEVVVGVYVEGVFKLSPTVNTFSLGY